MEHEPTGLELFLTKLAFLLYGKPVYKDFADRLPLNGNERALDFGCGIGTVAYYTAKRLINGHLVCIDISKRCIKHCRKTLRKYDNVTVLDAEDSLLPQDRFDVVYCHFVLHDIAENNLEKVIRDLTKALTPGGYFVFREPLSHIEKLGLIKRIITHAELSHNESRVIDIPLMGSTLESIYIKS